MKKYLAIYIFLLFSCNQRQIKNKIIIPLSVGSPTDINQEISGSFFSFVSLEGNRYLALDPGIKKLVLLDSSFHVIRTFGERGEGPAQFRNPPMSFSDGESIFCLEESKAITYSLSGELLQITPIDIPGRSGFSTECFHKENGLLLYGSNDPEYQIVGLDSELTIVFKWGKRVNNRDNAIPISVPDGTIVRIGTNDGKGYKLSTEGLILDSISLTDSDIFRKEQLLVDNIIQDQWNRKSLPIAQQALIHDDYLFIRIGTQPTDGRPTGFGANDVRKWLVLRWNPQLELIAEWEVPVEYGRLYTGFVIAPDSNALIAYEAERGEFHRLPFPEGFGE